MSERTCCIYIYMYVYVYIYVCLCIHRVLLIYNNLQLIQIQILWIHQVIKPVLFSHEFTFLHQKTTSSPWKTGKTGGFTSGFLRPGNGYDVLGLQSDTVEVLETNSSALRSFQVPKFFGYQKKTSGGFGSKLLVFFCLGASQREWFLVVGFCCLFCCFSLFVGRLLLFFGSRILLCPRKSIFSMRLLRWHQ